MGGSVSGYLILFLMDLCFMLDERGELMGWTRVCRSWGKENSNMSLMEGLRGDGEF